MFSSSIIVVMFLVCPSLFTPSFANVLFNIIQIACMKMLGGTSDTLSVWCEASIGLAYVKFSACRRRVVSYTTLQEHLTKRSLRLVVNVLLLERPRYSSSFLLANCGTIPNSLFGTENTTQTPSLLLSLPKVVANCMYVRHACWPSCATTFCIPLPLVFCSDGRALLMQLSGTQQHCCASWT